MKFTKKVYAGSIEYMFKIFKKDEILPQVLIAYKWRFPERLEISITDSKDGGYIAAIEDFPGCITQAETGRELFEMVHDALYTYLQIPKNYQPYMPTFYPPEELRKELGIKIPNKFLQGRLILERT